MLLPFSSKFDVSIDVICFHVYSNGRLALRELMYEISAAESSESDLSSRVKYLLISGLRDSRV